MTEWLARVDERVTSLVPRVDQVAPSPSGVLLAVFRARESDPDLVRRERVHIIERSTGREVVALDGPEILRGFAWVGEDALLVARDRDGGGATLRLHAVPDGGAEAELILSELSAGRVSIEVSADRSRALIAPWWMMSRQVSDARVVVLPSLAPLARVGVGDAPETAAFDALPVSVTLDPDGARTLVLWGDFEEGGYLSVHPTDLRAPRGPAVELRGAHLYVASWLSREQVLLSTRETFDLALPFRLDLARGEFFFVGLSTTELDIIADALRPDLDGRRVASLQQDARRLVHFSVCSTDARDAADLRPWRSALRNAFSLCWTAPDAVITACAESGRVHLARWRPDGGPARDLAAVEHASTRSDFSLSPAARDAVLLSQPYDAGGHRVSLVTVEP